MTQRLNLVVFDLELTCWDSKPSYTPEIIEIGAVKLNLSTGEIIDEFDTFVAPTEQPILTQYCTGLTSITQGDLKGQPQYQEAYNKFFNWVGSRHKNILVAWGSDWYDFEEECSRKSVEKRHSGFAHWDAKSIFAAKYTKLGLDKAGNLLGIPFTGVRHRAIDDARYTAIILNHLFGNLAC